MVVWYVSCLSRDEEHAGEGVRGVRGEGLGRGARNGDWRKRERGWEGDRVGGRGTREGMGGGEGPTGGKARLAGEVKEGGDRRPEDICVEDAGSVALPTKRQGEVY